ncbi:MAG: hypothetical protein KatS3mg011_1653 [Acidimicrobiia bacterium]|nr:MAG: hypothetical protein KatS3mg011_1653 [Acidimicrobiia bacterium]
MIDHQAAYRLIELYAMDALEGAERQEVERHLHRCETCSEYLALSRSVLAALVPDEPPPWHVWNRMAGRLTSRASSTRRRLGLGWTAVAASVLLLVGLGVAMLNSEPSLAQLAAAVASRPDARVVELTADGDPVARVVMAPDGLGFLIPSDRLVDLDESRTYQLWVVNHEGAVISAGVLGNRPRVASFTWEGPITGVVLTREPAGGVPTSRGDVVAAAEF